MNKLPDLKQVKNCGKPATSYYWEPILKGDNISHTKLYLCKDHTKVVVGVIPIIHLLKTPDSVCNELIEVK